MSRRGSELWAQRARDLWLVGYTRGEALETAPSFETRLDMARAFDACELAEVAGNLATLQDAMAKWQSGSL